MKLLLDAHTFLWFISGDNALSSTARALIEDDANENLISIATLWEIGIKNSLGKLPLSKPFGELIPDQLNLNGIQIQSITIEHISKLISLPFHHRDPFDRILVAQSLIENVPVISNDAALDSYGMKRLW